MHDWLKSYGNNKWWMGGFCLLMELAHKVWSLLPTGLLCLVYNALGLCNPYVIQWTPVQYWSDTDLTQVSG